MEFKNLSLLELDALVQDGKATYAEIYAYFLERAKHSDPELNAFNLLPEEMEEVGGLPIAVKDIFCEEGIRTTASSKMLAHFAPPYESTVTKRLKQAGFVGFGKTNMDEFAMGGAGERSAFGPTKNPWDTTRIP